MIRVGERGLTARRVDARMRDAIPGLTDPKASERNDACIVEQDVDPAETTVRSSLSGLHLCQSAAKLGDRGYTSISDRREVVTFVLRDGFAKALR